MIDKFNIFMWTIIVTFGALFVWAGLAVGHTVSKEMQGVRFLDCRATLQRTFNLVPGEIRDQYCGCHVISVATDLEKMPDTEITYTNLDKLDDKAHVLCNLEQLQIIQQQGGVNE